MHDLSKKFLDLEYGFSEQFLVSLAFFVRERRYRVFMLDL